MISDARAHDMVMFASRVNIAANRPPDNTVSMVSGNQDFVRQLVMAQNVGFTPNTSLGDEIAGAYGIALFVRVFRSVTGEITE